MINAFDLASSRPWLITEEALHQVLMVADRMGDPQALSAKMGKPLDNTRTVDKRSNGIAVVPVTGPIFRYANLFTEISGATSTEVLATDLQAAIDDPSVRAIVLDINSPGGEVTGINELAQMIASSSKTIVGYGGGLVASAAYWLGAAASKSGNGTGSLVLDGTALAGSIGVVMSMLDTSQRDSKADVKRIEIVSSASPDKRIDPTTDSGRAKVQATVDALAEVFINSVAQFRGVTADKVKTDFGRGGVLVGQAAVDAGMADAVGSLEGVIADLAVQVTSPTYRRMQMATQKSTVSVSNTDDLRIALAAGYTGDQITIDHSKAVETARTEAHAGGVAAGKAAAAEETKALVANAAKAERERLTGLAAIAEPGFEAEHKAAIEGGHTPEQFALAQMKAAKDRGVTLGAIKKDSTRAPHSSAPADPAATAEAKAGWDKVAAKYGGGKKAA